MEYERYTIGQLREFIQERNGRILRDGIPKAKLLKEIRKLDDQATFRFRDLPAELRNRIYRELIGGENLSSERPKLYPAILATSKEINLEATSILYEEATMRITIESFAVTERKTFRTRRPHVWVGAAARVRIGTLDMFESRRHSGLWSTVDRWHQASGLRSINHVALDLNLYGSDQYSGKIYQPYIKVNHELFLLASMLQAGGTIKTVSISFVDEQRALSVAQVDSILYPLTQMGGTVDFSFRRLQHACQTHFRAQLTRDSGVFETLRLHRTVMEKAEALISLFSTTTSGNSGTCRSSLLRRIAKISRCMRDEALKSAEDIDKLNEEIRLLHRYIDGKRVQEAEEDARDEMLEEKNADS